MTPTKLNRAIVGRGYVGLPLAVAFAKKGIRVIGFDISREKIALLKKGIDPTGELENGEVSISKIVYTADPRDLKKANFIIVAVPTPIDEAKQPDLTPVRKSAELIGKNLSKNTVVVYESTVYPGVTEEICGPILEKFSGLRRGKDFQLGYSPERVNPGDKEHTLGKIVKVVSGMDYRTLKRVASVYKIVCEAGVYEAPNIKTAEAAKVIENIQRDLNIALVNELALIFSRAGISTDEVLKAAGTNWNFHNYRPGLVGGHCIGVDPYYLTYLAQKLGYHPRVILAGREINDYMPEYAAELIVKGLVEAGKTVQGSKVLIMGLTFKENINDTRNSKAKDVIRRLKEYQIEVWGHDPMLSDGEVNHFGVKNIVDLKSMPKVDAVALLVIHDQLKNLTLAGLKKLMRGRGVLMDVKNHFSKENKKGIVYKNL
ncbi:MAG: nucleotide sugar dehydrogenase [bacterium]|nr:nucleotide sugar dehydrogenase [bacterium]